MLKTARMNATLILSIILVYFGVLYTISYFTSRSATNESFFTGNRQSPWYVVAFGMVGSSLSGVTFISVPGWVSLNQFAYLQIIFGYFIGYMIIATVLLPVYYRLQLTSIYTYLQKRFGEYSYKTGASFFLLSRLLGSAARLYLVADVLQYVMFDAWGIPFEVTVFLTIAFIWVYTYKGGIKTIIWTDTLQTTFMLGAVAVTILYIKSHFGWSFSDMASQISDSQYSRVFFFDDWADKKHFVKYVLSGALITIVMTGLDQDMMQKNLSCRSIGDAKKNMVWFSIVLVAVNFMFLCLGALLYMFVSDTGMTLPDKADMLYPVLSTNGYMPQFLGIVFILGLVAAAYSSADSALTALTTSFAVDIVGIENKSEKQVKRLRMIGHLGFSLLMLACVLYIRELSGGTIIDTIFVLAGYTYGPLLGMYAFGLFTSRNLRDKVMPYIAVFGPLFCLLLQYLAETKLGYSFGYELLLINGMVCFGGMYLFSDKHIGVRVKL